MDEDAGFEARAVLAPRRARQSRLALLMPVVALAVITWAGLSGPRGSRTTPETSDSPVVAAGSRAVEAATPPGSTLPPQVNRPATVIGLEVRRLDELQPKALGRDDVIAVVGWYVATSISDCPQRSPANRSDGRPDTPNGADTLASCRRSGTLYASPPDVQDSWSDSPGLRAVGTRILVGVVVPPQLEVIGPTATQVVVVGRLLDTGTGCGTAGCDRELVVDHIAWTAAA